MKQTVYVVDDDLEMREALCWLIKSVDLSVEGFESAESFLSAYDGASGCLVLDVRMKGMSGLQLQDKLLESQHDLPIIFISGHGDIPMAVRTMKAGAIEFLTKPFNNQELLDLIQNVLTQNAEKQKYITRRIEITERYQRLTPREREVMAGMVSGKLNKTIAYEFGISVHTVELHRAKVMKKMEASTIAKLINMALKNKLIEND